MQYAVDARPAQSFAEIIAVCKAAPAYGDSVEGWDYIHGWDAAALERIAADPAERPATRAWARDELAARVAPPRVTPRAPRARARAPRARRGSSAARRDGGGEPAPVDPPSPPSPPSPDGLLLSTSSEPAADPDALVDALVRLAAAHVRARARLGPGGAP